MKKIIILFAILTIFTGCSNRRPAQDKKILARINNYEITKAEFEHEFKLSAYGSLDTPSSRQEFLNQLINRKLILQDAQAKGLGTDEGFLKMVERFWEQSLLKLALDKKAKEIAGSTSVSEKAIEETYGKMLSEGKTDKNYSQMYSQIKWEITKIQETQIMNSWLNGLHKKATIKINEQFLKP